MTNCKTIVIIIYLTCFCVGCLARKQNEFFAVSSHLITHTTEDLGVGYSISWGKFSRVAKLRGRFSLTQYKDVTISQFESFNATDYSYSTPPDTILGADPFFSSKFYVRGDNDLNWSGGLIHTLGLRYGKHARQQLALLLTASLYTGAGVQDERFKFFIDADAKVSISYLF